MKGPRSVAAFPLTACQRQLFAFLSAVPGSVALKLSYGGNAIPETKYDRPTYFCTFKQ